MICSVAHMLVEGMLGDTVQGFEMMAFMYMV